VILNTNLYSLANFTTTKFKQNAKNRLTKINQSSSNAFRWSPIKIYIQHVHVCCKLELEFCFKYKEHYLHANLNA